MNLAGYAGEKQGIYITDKARFDVWFCSLINELCCIPDIDNKANSNHTTEVIVGTEWKM